MAPATAITVCLHISPLTAFSGWCSSSKVRAPMSDRDGASLRDTAITLRGWTRSNVQPLRGANYGCDRLTSRPQTLLGCHSQATSSPTGPSTTACAMKASWRAKGRTATGPTYAPPSAHPRQVPRRRSGVRRDPELHGLWIRLAKAGVTGRSMCFHRGCNDAWVRLIGVRRNFQRPSTRSDWYDSPRNGSPMDKASCPQLMNQRQHWR